MNWRKATALVVGLTASAVMADVVVDNMNSTGKKSLSGGYWFVTQDGKSDNTITEQSSFIEFPSLSRQFTFYDLSLAPKPEIGKVAYLSGRIGSSVEFPFLATGFNLTELKDTIDLSSVTHIAFRARGVGAWGFKIKSPVADAIATAMGKEPGQVDWRYDFSSSLDSVNFTWMVCTPAELTATTKAFRDTLNGRSLSIADGMKKVYQVQWGTVGYKAADAGTNVWLQLDDLIFLGGTNKLGVSAAQPTADQKNAILAGSNSSILLTSSPRVTARRQARSNVLCDIAGRASINRTANGMALTASKAVILIGSDAR